jgi:P27 family predicted phage terminase small subunit
VKRGRRPKPTYLKLVAGNPGGRSINQNEPQPVGDLVEPPAWFNAAQRDSWTYALANAPKGLLKRIDSALLTIWVCAEVMHSEAMQKVTRMGMLVKAPNTGVAMQNPYLSIANKQASIMTKTATEMGFSPTSRSSIAVDPAKRNAFANNGRRLTLAPPPT